MFLWYVLQEQRLIALYCGIPVRLSDLTSHNFITFAAFNSITTNPCYYLPFRQMNLWCLLRPYTNKYYRNVTIKPFKRLYFSYVYLINMWDKYGK